MHLLAWDMICQPLRQRGLGVHSLMMRREALIARHVAKYVLEPEGLWSSMMRAKYESLTTATGFQVGRQCSYIWREMCARALMVLSRIRWTIGDGRSIDVMNDAWISELPLRRWPTTVSPERVELRVYNLLHQGEKRWDVDLIRGIFGDLLSERILAVSIPRQGGPNRRIWSLTTRAKVRV